MPRVGRSESQQSLERQSQDDGWIIYPFPFAVGETQILAAQLISFARVFHQKITQKSPKHRPLTNFFEFRLPPYGT